MTHKFYKICKTVLCLLCIPLILLWRLGDKIPWVMHHPLLAGTVFYAIPVLSLSLLYFGIYAYMCKIRPTHKIDSPVTLITFGAILTLLSYGPQIQIYFRQPDITIEPLSAVDLQSLKEKALDPTKKPGDRLSSAKYYYIETGKFVEYLDTDGRQTCFLPSKSDRIEYEKYVKNRQCLKNIDGSRKTTITILLTLAVVSGLGFLMFLMWKIRTRNTLA